MQKQTQNKQHPITNLAERESPWITHKNRVQWIASHQRTYNANPQQQSTIEQPSSSATCNNNDDQHNAELFYVQSHPLTTNRLILNCIDSSKPMPYVSKETFLSNAVFTTILSRLRIQNCLNIYDCTIADTPCRQQKKRSKQKTVSCSNPPTIHGQQLNCPLKSRVSVSQTAIH